jgi:signal transduction histidine kinase/ActR/RegA family two-component response regulator
MNNQNENYLGVAVEEVPTIEQYIAEIAQLHRAILKAQEIHAVEAEAIANECTAKFYLKWGKAQVAAAYMQDAHDCYTRAGCNIASSELVRDYPQLLKPIIQRSQQPDKINSYFDEEFIATLSYEFRTPLNGILGMSEALLEEAFGVMNEQQLNAVTTIDRSGGYLSALISNMTDLSQLQAGKLELEITKVAVADLCRFSTNFVKHHAIQKQIQLDTDIPAHAGLVAVDLQRMRQVLINLLSHAINATPVGGKVTLVVTRQQTGSIIDETATINLSVIDTSKEIATINNEQFCSSFLPTDVGSSGLGLMLVHPIVELHGGSFNCQNTIGQGSCMSVLLPHTCLIIDLDFDENGISADLGGLSGSIAQKTLQPPLILIVEDNELNINTISSYLTAKGYRPIIAQDGAAAIVMTQKYHPDLILMDIQMPGMDGLEAIARIRQQPELVSIPIIALTALAMDGDREKCLAAGANYYLTKPVKLKTLNATIQQFLISTIDNTYTLSGMLT